MNYRTIIVIVISSTIVGNVASNFSPKGEWGRILSSQIMQAITFAEKARLVARNLLHGYAIKGNVRNFEVK